MRFRALFVALGALAGALAADAASPPSPFAPTGEIVTTNAGVLSCPFALDGKGEGYLHLANFDDEASKLRITIVPVEGKAVAIDGSIEAHAVTSMRLSGRVKGAASTVVEYTGGTVVASHQLVRGRTEVETGMAEAPCVRAGPRVTVVAPGRTIDADTTLALFNPGTADADVSVSLIADDRAIRPERLSRRVIPGRSRRDFRLGDFAFDSRAVVAIVTATTGRVVAEGLVSTTRGIELLPAQVPSTSLVGLLGGTARGAMMAVAAIGREEAALDAHVAGVGVAAAQARAPETVTPSSVTRLPVAAQKNGGAAAFVLTSFAGSPLAGGTSWPDGSPARELGSVPALAPALRWGAVIGAVGGKPATEAIIAAPEGARARVRIVGPAGTSTAEVTLDAAGVQTVPVGRVAGTFAVLVEADGPVAVALRSAGVRSGGQPLAQALAAVPLRAPARVAVRIDPREGVTAPLPVV